MKTKIKIPCSILFYFLFFTSAVAQQLTIEGTVTDSESGEALPGVNIVLQGTTTGTSTDLEGEYSLQVPDLEGTLVFSFIGYQTQEIPIQGREVIDVALESAALVGEELVVVGYGSVRKRDLTGSVSGLRERDFSQGVVTSLDQLIGSKVAGVRFIQGTNLPGSGVDINIRGASSINAGNGPLYVVDGVPIDNSNATEGSGEFFTNTRSPRNPLNNINPSDIESIDVLKDASATAIYGSRGANGVIIINTKSGRSGEMLIDYEGSIGFQTKGNQIDLLSAEEYEATLNAIIDEGGGNEGSRVENIANNGVGTDWQDVIFRSASPVTNHNLSLSGGNEDITYFTSFNYFDQDAIVEESSLVRYTARLNLDAKLTDKLTTGLNLSTAYTKDTFVPTGFGINFFSGVIQSAYKFDPTLPIRDENGEFTTSNFILADNPVGQLETTSSVSNTYRTFGSVFAEYSIIPQVTVKLNVGGDATSQRRNTFVGNGTQFGSSVGGSGTVLDGRKTNYLVEGTANYNETLSENHTIDVIGGLSFQRFVTDRLTGTAQDFPSEGTQSFNLGLGNPDLNVVNSQKFTNELVSYFGRINYNLLDKYLFTTTLRADGSSRFGPNNRFGIFPSGAVAWRLSNENFMQPINFISELKLRGSFGKSGNQNIGELQFTETFGSGAAAVFDDSEITSVAPNRLANPDLRWETTTQFNIGLDFGLLNDKISGSVEYFKKKTNDMLINLPVPSSTGFNSRLSNVGKIENDGIEAVVSTRNITNSNFQWNTNVSLATLNNEVTDLGGLPEIITGSASQFLNQIGILREGVPAFSFFGWDVEGVWQTDDDFSVTSDNVQPGDMKFRDVNGDGTINADDRVILGNSFPDFTWSVENNFSYKNFDLSILFTGIDGIEMINANLVDTFFPISFRDNRFAEPLLNRWTPDNPTNKFPSFVNPNAQGNRSVNSITVQDASYIRLKTVRLSYTFNEIRYLPSIRNLTVYTTVENVFTITDYLGPDPAVNPNSNSNLRIDWNSAPELRSFILGLRLGL